MSGPPSSEELELRRRASTGTVTLSELLRLHAICTERGESLPLDWEERALRLALPAETNRVDLQARLRQVLLLQGKEASPLAPAAEAAVSPSRLAKETPSAAHWHKI